MDTYFTKVWKHFKKVMTHKRWVAHYCFMCGLYAQGILHDMSKFSPCEFLESVKYYQGTRSPISACKEAIGYSNAWFHHRGRNKHHWEYWVDDFENGTIPKKMPFKYALEMICDWLGAGRAYNGKKFSMQAEYDWWQRKRPVLVIHEDTKQLVDELFGSMLNIGIRETLSDKALLKELKHRYETKPKK